MKPYLSIVATSRNDNHGGDLLKRMEYFMNGIIQQSTKFQLEVELIIVEWNPPKEAKKLPEVLNIQKPDNYCEVKIIELSQELHNSFKNNNNLLPLYQMIAKNVGIQRAKGEFVLATNIDLLFSHELFEFFAKKQLQKNHFYRANRYDIDNNLPQTQHIDDWLEFAKKNIVRENTFYGSRMTQSWLFSQVHQDGTKSGDKVPRGGIAVYGNASGDFQLLHRDIWQKSRGYVEWDAYSFHMDSLFEYVGVFLCEKEVILPNECCSYHIEHGDGYQFNNTNSMDNKIKREYSDKIQSSELRAWGELMSREKRAFLFNHENWGLKDKKLPTTSLGV